jgi:hypothetical protein
MRLHEMALSSPGCPTVVTRRRFLGPLAGEALVGDPGCAVLGRPGLGQGSYGKGSYGRAQLLRWLCGEYLHHLCFDGRPVVVLDEALSVKATEPRMPIDLSGATLPKPFDPLAFGPSGGRESRGR